MQLFHESHNVTGANVLVPDAEPQFQLLALRCEMDRSQHGQAIVAIPATLDRRLTSQRPSAASYRLKAKARFVKKYHRFTATAGPLLIRGQVRLRQRRIASSSRSRANCSGF